MQVQESFLLLIDAEAREEVPAVPSVAMVKVEKICYVLSAVLEDDM